MSLRRSLVEEGKSHMPWLCDVQCSSMRVRGQSYEKKEMHCSYRVIISSVSPVLNARDTRRYNITGGFDMEVPVENWLK